METTFGVSQIVNVEAQTWEAMMSRFEAFTQRVETLCEGQDKSLQKWLDNQDVCQILNVSKRTLQTYRDNGTLAYSQINHKTYYKPQDVEKALPLVEEKRKQANHQGKEL